ncbi:MAG: metal ABC transporter solute-binding protein, Zn/Mn family [Planctomycetota bacterium]|jgi:zinc transport system substrate-binding protein
MRTRGVGVLLLAVLLGLMGCGDGEPVVTPAGRPVVMTTFYPTTYFAERIGGSVVEVVCPVPEDEDAIFWKPDEETIRRYQEADLIVINGAEFEKWVLVTSLPNAKVVDTAKPLTSELISFEHAVTHSHGPAGEHEHKGIDGHTWLDPVNALTQARRVLFGLVRILPSRERSALEARFEELEAELVALDQAFRRVTEGYEGQPILASHPAYNYIARRYGWNVVNLDLDPEEMPDDETFASIAELLAETPATHILWESAPKEEIADRMRSELGLTSVEFSPCELLSAAQLAAGEDYMTVMRGNLERLRPVLK